MSESQETTNIKPEATKPAVPAAKPEAEAPKPVEAGPVCKQLIEAGFALTPVASDAGGTETIVVASDKLLDCAKQLQAIGFDLLLSVAGVDWKTHREVVYHFYSTLGHTFLALKVQATSDDKLPSLTPIYEAANWHERETFDLFGITFEGHPKLERILMPSDWIGYPLRKDYVLDDPRLVWNER